MKKDGYKGLVIDRMGDKNHRTKYYATWVEAHQAAERLAKRLGLYRGDRWTIVVIDADDAG